MIGQRMILARKNGQVEGITITADEEEFFSYKSPNLKRPATIQKSNKSVKLFTDMDEAINWITEQRK